MSSNPDSLKSNTVHVYPQEVDKELGAFPNIHPDYAYGRVLDADAADLPRTAWSFADDDRVTRADTKTYPTVSDDFYMVSDNALDTAIEFTISSLDATGDLQTLVASTDATNGTTPVLIGSGLDINFVFMSGADKENLGEVYFTHGSNFTAGVPNDVTKVLAHAPAGYGCSPQAAFTVPNNRKAIIHSFTLTISRQSGALGSAIIHCRAKRAGGSWLVVREWHTQVGHMVLPGVGMAFDPGTIVEMRLVDASDTNTSFGAEIHFDYVDL